MHLRNFKSIYHPVRVGNIEFNILSIITHVSHSPKHTLSPFFSTFLAEFTHTHIFSPTQIELLGRLSGCISHRKPKTNCTEERCFHSKYRSIDGTCNNMANSMWGSSYTPFQRLLNPEYENGFNLPKGKRLCFFFFGKFLFFSKNGR